MHDIERKFLLAVERGDLDTLKHLLGSKDFTFNKNCCDPLARNAFVIAIDNRNVEIIELLIDSKVNLGDALLYAIDKNFVEAVELLLDHQASSSSSSTLDPKEPDRETSSFFSADITPLTLAAHRNNFEIIKILLDRRVSHIPNPHKPRCGCKTCRQARADDCLNHSRSRINAYKALASPCFMALSSPDPLLTAFEMSAELENLAKLEPEYKQDYLRLRAQCQTFATKLLDHTRTSKELEILLNYSDLEDHKQNDHDYSSMRLARLRLAIQCKQKTFCAHPNIQELLASMWYENLPGFRNKSIFAQIFQVISIGLLFPLYSIAYLLAPRTQLGQYIKRPFIKFICHSASYITFLLVLILASQRIEAFYCWGPLFELFSATGSTSSSSSSINLQMANLTLLKQIRASAPPPPSSSFDDADLNTLAAIYKQLGSASVAGSARSLDGLSKIFEEMPASAKKRGVLPSPIEVLILVWVLSLIWQEVKQLKSLGMNYYKDDMWNILDSVASGFYIGTIALRLLSYIQSDEASREVAREHWHAYDPLLLSEGLFAAATIFSALKLVYIFSLNPYLGPLQISLGRMIIDILRFSWIYMLVLFAFACGMNQLLWYYADLERHQCLNVTNYNLAQYYGAQSKEHSMLAAPPVASNPNETALSSPVSFPAIDPNLNATASGNKSTTLIESQVLAGNNMTDEKLIEAAISASFEDDLTKPPVTMDDSCKTWRHFSNVFESSQTLFWANFGLVDLENFDLTGIRQYTRFWALLMFGCYCFINVIVVLNLLIAMMNHSYVKISTRSDVEWKFARTRLWMSYFDTGSTVPAPFNIIPSTKSVHSSVCAVARIISKLSKRVHKFAKSVFCCLCLWRQKQQQHHQQPCQQANSRGVKIDYQFIDLSSLDTGDNKASGLAAAAATTTTTTTAEEAAAASVEKQNQKTKTIKRRERAKIHGSLTANYRNVIKTLVRRYLINEQRLLEKCVLTEANLNRWAKLNAFDQ